MYILSVHTHSHIFNFCLSLHFITVQLLQAKADGKLLEVFGAGTAAVISPVGGIYYQGQMHEIPAPQTGLSSQ